MRDAPRVGVVSGGLPPAAMRLTVIVSTPPNGSPDRTARAAAGAVVK
jgi:hypothetical protein